MKKLRIAAACLALAALAAGGNAAFAADTPSDASIQASPCCKN